MYLSATQRAEPPSFQAAGVLFQNGEDVAFAERQFVGRFGHVVVQRLGHAILLLKSKIGKF